MSKSYAHALLKAVFGKTDAEIEAILERLIALLRERKELSLLPEIVALVKKEYARGLRRGDVELHVPSQEEVTLRAEHIEKTAAELGVPNEKRTIVLDPTLTAGFILKAQNVQIDNSAKRNLFGLYKTLSGFSHQ